VAIAGSGKSAFVPPVISQPLATLPSCVQTHSTDSVVKTGVWRSWDWITFGNGGIHVRHMQHLLSASGSNFHGGLPNWILSIDYALEGRDKGSRSLLAATT
jgi:hypothetical protein